MTDDTYCTVQFKFENMRIKSVRLRAMTGKYLSISKELIRNYERAEHLMVRRGTDLYLDIPIWLAKKEDLL